jgi:hypothetical protein
MGEQKSKQKLSVQAARPFAQTYFYRTKTDFKVGYLI